MAPTRESAVSSGMADLIPGGMSGAKEGVRVSGIVVRMSY